MAQFKRKTKSTGKAPKAPGMKPPVDETAPMFDKELRDRFVTEYLKDFNNGAAYTRAVGPEIAETLAWKTLQNSGWKMRHDTYVSRKIHETLKKMEEDEICSRKEILAGLKREAHYEGFDSQHGARVSAWAQLGKFMGMDQKRVEVNLASQGGILLVPAVVDNSTDWEKRAAAAQAALKESVRK